MNYLVLLFGMFNVFASDMCVVNPKPGTRLIPMPKEPQFFFRASPDGKKIFFISDRENFILDTQTYQLQKIMGDADPVPSTDGLLLSYLQDTNDGVSINFQTMNPPWNTSNLRSSSGPTITGASYQSLSGLQIDGKRTLMYANRSELTITKVAQVGSRTILEKPTVLNYSEYRLIILSPDGKKFSALNTSINRTQIFSLEGNPPKPKLLETLPVGGGKASFSPDGSKVTFHLTRMLSADRDPDKGYQFSRWLGGDEKVLDIFVYDFKTKNGPGHQ